MSCFHIKGRNQKRRVCFVEFAKWLYQWDIKTVFRRYVFVIFAGMRHWGQSLPSWTDYILMRQNLLALCVYRRNWCNVNVCDVAGQNIDAVQRAAQWRRNVPLCRGQQRPTTGQLRHQRGRVLQAASSSRPVVLWTGTEPTLWPNVRVCRLRYVTDAFFPFARLGGPQPSESTPCPLDID